MPPEVRRRRKTNLFTNELRSLLFAFGDVANPDPDTVAVLEDILEEYITAVCYEAYRVARVANRQKLKVEDFKFALRNDPVKLGRVEELLSLNKVITEARRQFDNSEGKSLSKKVDEYEAGDAAAGANAPAGAAPTSNGAGAAAGSPGDSGDRRPKGGPDTKKKRT